jgi:hypothetical protein
MCEVGTRVVSPSIGPRRCGRLGWRWHEMSMNHRAGFSRSIHYGGSRGTYVEGHGQPVVPLSVRARLGSLTGDTWPGIGFCLHNPPRGNHMKAVGVVPGSQQGKHPARDCGYVLSVGIFVFPISFRDTSGLRSVHDSRAELACTQCAELMQRQ